MSAVIRVRMQDSSIGWVEVVVDEDDEEVAVTGHLFEAARFEDGQGTPILSGRIHYDQLGRYEDGNRFLCMIDREIDVGVFRARSGHVYRVRGWA